MLKCHFSFLLTCACLFAGVFHSRGNPSSDPFRGLDVPQAFIQLKQARDDIDRFQLKHYEVENGVQSTPAPLYGYERKGTELVRVVHAAHSQDVLRYRAANSTPVDPLPGFRAPILGAAEKCWPARLATNELSNAELRAAAHIAERLGRDGLLATLVDTLELLGAEPFVKDGEAGVETLARLGFPCDLLRHFGLREIRCDTSEIAPVVEHIARRLTLGVSAAAIKSDFARARFSFVPTRENFELATESGEHEVGLLRMQAGGGFRDGVIPGTSLDVIAQCIAAFPGADALVSVPSEIADELTSIAKSSWRLRRKHQATLVMESSPVAAWAQDNGKGGIIYSGDQTILGTIAPRYANSGEGRSRFEPGESFLMDGVKAAGHEVIHSPLLFQGGNLLAVRDPKSGERILLVGEGEIVRNIALGLTPAQVQQAFQREFAADRCVILPAVSYHADFDVSLRAHDSEIIAFVNDTRSAARGILRLGVDALQANGTLAKADAEDIHKLLLEKKDAEAARALEGRAPRALGHVSIDKGSQSSPLQSAPLQPFPATLSKHFVADHTDAADRNLQTFLLAIDVLAAAEEPKTKDVERRNYLLALRKMEEGSARQAAQFKQLGWRIVPIPSMTELVRGINYLNGIQHRHGYVMPSFGGFYAALDRDAIDAFRRALGPEARITPIRSAECQRQQGGVHCTTSVYPRLQTVATSMLPVAR